MKLRYKLYTTIVMVFCYCYTRGQVPFPDVNINGQTFTSGVHFFSGATGIVSPSDGSNVQVSQTANVTYHAGQSIKLMPGFSASGFVSHGDFEAIIRKDVDLVIMEPTTTPGTVGKYEKFEIGVKTTDAIKTQINNFLSGSTGINPYDPNQIEVYTVIQSPSGSFSTVNGFYFEDYAQDLSSNDWTLVSTEYPWRIRIAPNELGTWKGTVFVNAGGSTYINYFQFSCVASSNPGYLTKGFYQQMLRFSGSSQPFFAIGQNIAWPIGIPAGERAKPTDYNLQRGYMSDLHNKGGNYFRLIMAPWNNLIEFEELGNYKSRQRDMWELDKIIDLAHTDNLYTILSMETFTHLQDSNPYGAPNWSQNPYNSIAGVNVPVDFFSNADAKAMYKRKLRYITARWGYSTNIAALEFFNEVDNIQGYSGSSVIRDATVQWHDEMIDYIRFDLGEIRHLLTTSYAGEPDFPFPSAGHSVFINSKIGITNRHQYGGNGENTNYTIKYDDLVWDPSRFVPPLGLSIYGKPYIMEEMGTDPLSIDQCTDLEFHNAIWSTAFMGGYGTGLQWTNWEDDNFRNNIKAISSFFNGMNLDNDHYIPQKSPGAKGDITTFALRSMSQERVYGWLNNKTNNYSNISPCGSGSITAVDGAEKMEIDALKLMEKYSIDFYTAPRNGTSSPYYYTEKTTNIFGKLKQPVASLLSENYDYAFKIFDIGSRESINFSMEADTLDCPNDSIFVVGMYKNDSLGVYTYHWDFGNGDTSALAHPTVYYSSPGTYNVSLVVSGNNFSDTLTQQITVQPCDSTRQLLLIANNSADNLSRATLYPNPSNGNFTVLCLDETIRQIIVYDVYGNIVKDQNFGKQEAHINMFEQTGGMYYVRIILKSGQVLNQKIVVNP
jgi:hypothetical protein